MGKTGASSAWLTRGLGMRLPFLQIREGRFVLITEDSACVGDFLSPDVLDIIQISLRRNYEPPGDFATCYATVLAQHTWSSKPSDQTDRAVCRTSL
jgi:hypothetical protein